MKAFRPSWIRSKQRGAVLLAALCFATVLAICVGGYITLCYRTLEFSNRSMHSGRSVELAETGMEEALWALNKNQWDTWTISGSIARKTLSGFSYGNGTTGEVSIEIKSFDGSAGTRTVTVVGKTTLADGTVLQRTLTSSSERAPLFLNAVAGTTGRVKFKSGGTVDSYDSSLGTYASQTPGFSAIISSGSKSTLSATVQLTNVEVKGYVATLSTGPSYSTSAKLIGPTTPVTTKIDTSRITTSPYQPVFEEIVPTGTGSTLAAGTVTIGNPGATSPEIYRTTDLSLTDSQVLTVDGPVILVVSNNLVIENAAKIAITANGSLRLHVGGDVQIGGNGIDNATQVPKNFILIATRDSDESFSLDTNQPLYGAIYAPLNVFTVSYNTTIYGAIVARSVTFLGWPTIHYDMALRSVNFSGIDIPYAVSNWSETTNAD
jgi:hypothetical protein